MQASPPPNDNHASIITSREQRSTGQGLSVQSVIEKVWPGDVLDNRHLQGSIKQASCLILSFKKATKYQLYFFGFILAFKMIDAAMFHDSASSGTEEWFRK